MHRTVVGRFDGGKFSSDAGGLLLRKGEQRCHILKRLALSVHDTRMKTIMNANDLASIDQARDFLSGT